MNTARARSGNAVRAQLAARRATPARPEELAVAGSLAARIALGREQLRHAVAEAAYYRAQKRGYVPGSELEDWLVAEAEILGK